MCLSWGKKKNGFYFPGPLCTLCGRSPSCCLRGCRQPALAGTSESQIVTQGRVAVGGLSEQLPPPDCSPQKCLCSWVQFIFKYSSEDSHPSLELTDSSGGIFLPACRLQSSFVQNLPSSSVLTPSARPQPQECDLCTPHSTKSSKTGLRGQLLKEMFCLFPFLSLFGLAKTTLLKKRRKKEKNEMVLSGT